MNTSEPIRSSSSRRNLKTATVLLSVVAVFFVGIVVRQWLWPGL